MRISTEFPGAASKRSLHGLLRGVTMRPTWLIEADIYGQSMDPFKAEICRQGMEFGIIHHEGFSSGYQHRIGHRDLRDDDCIIFIGTWPLWRTIELHWPGWTPAGWCATANLDCAAYYPHFERYLLNRHYTIMTGIDAIRRQQELYAAHGRENEVFVRPTGCLKLFNGRCIEASSFANALAPARYDPETRVLVSDPKSVDREWRFVIADHRPLAASQYYEAGVKRLVPGCPAEVWAFVDVILEQVAWEPDEVFMMDVCESEGKLHIVELNGFSCAGLYECDRAKVVERASQIAERAWKRKYQPSSN